MRRLELDGSFRINMSTGGVKPVRVLRVYAEDAGSRSRKPSCVLVGSSDAELLRHTAIALEQYGSWEAIGDAVAEAREAAP